MKHNQNINRDFQILIQKYLDGKITIEEIKLLINYYESFQESHDWVEDLGSENELKSKMLINILGSIEDERPSKVIPFYRTSIFKYAATILLFIALAFTIGYNTFYNEAAITKKALTEISPGYSKATLVLSDGTKVDLDAHKNELISQDDVSTIQNTDSGLVYDVVNNIDEKNEIAELKYNTLFVPNGGVYQIKLPDGTKVWLNSATSLKFPERFVGDKREVTLYGEAYFEVTKDKKPFIVTTNTASVTVLGTQFNVCSYIEDTYFSSTLVEGSVKLSSTLNDNSEVLKPFQRAVITKGEDVIDLKPVDVKIYTSWKNGKFVFERESLEHILIKMSRWYDVDIVFENENLKNQTFTGVAYKNKSIENLLNMITQITKANYKITKNSKSGKYEITLF